MAALQASDIADLITTTQKDLGRMKWTDISYSLQEHVALPMILQKEKVSYQSGNALQWNVQTATSGAAKDTGLYAIDNVNVTDVMPHWPLTLRAGSGRSRLLLRLTGSTASRTGSPVAPRPPLVASLAETPPIPPRVRGLVASTPTRSPTGRTGLLATPT